MTKILTEAQRAKQREYHLKYRQTHREVLKERSRQYRINNADKVQAYYELNKEEITAKSKKYREENIEHCRQVAREYYAANKEAMQTKAKQWRDANKDKIRSYTKAYNDAHREQLRANSKRYYAKRKEAVLQLQAELASLQALVDQYKKGGDNVDTTGCNQ